MKRTETKIRFDTIAQRDRVERAAKLKKWSLNRFLVESAHEAANRELSAVPQLAQQAQAEIR